MLLAAIYWYADKKETEPLIVILGQIAAFITLASGEISTKVSNKDVQNTKMFLKGQGSIKNDNVSDSYIDVDNK
jgi:hypothetical protein